MKSPKLRYKGEYVKSQFEKGKLEVFYKHRWIQVKISDLDTEPKNEDKFQAPK